MSKLSLSTRRFLPKSLCAIFVLLACCAFSQTQADSHLSAIPQQPQVGVSDLVKSSVDSVVLIVVSDESEKPMTEGSGFIVSADGKIATNHHVIQGARSATVKLNNGSFFTVDGILADDPDHDITILKVSGRNLPALSLADSDHASVGDHVVAIGSPLGLQNSVSDGIISAFREDAKGRQWIQTTAAASHGNSGGPLLTMRGEALGLLTWKASEGENLNFAVPSKLLAPMLATSNIVPLGTKAKADIPDTVASDKIWTSITSGRDYKVRISDEYLYTEWVNLPAQLQGTGAFMRAELKKNGANWTGTVHSHFPCSQVKWCSVDREYEIDELSETRIVGRADTWKSFDCRKCQPHDEEVKPFTLIPK